MARRFPNFLEQGVTDESSYAGAGPVKGGNLDGARRTGPDAHP